MQRAATIAIPSVRGVSALPTTCRPATPPPVQRLRRCLSRCVRPVAMMSPGMIFTHTSAIMVPIYGMMIFSPHSKATRTVVTTPVVPLVMSLLYVFLLSQAAAAGLADTVTSMVKGLTAPFFFPDATVLATLFHSPLVTNLAWVHLLLLDFCQARAVFVDGIKSAVPTRHSIALCFMFGPLGLLCHFVTRALTKAGGRGPALAPAV